MKYNNWNKRQLNEQLNLSYDLFNISQTEDFAHAIYTLNSLLSNRLTSFVYSILTSFGTSYLL